MALSREYDQAGLDAQYNCRGMVSDFDDHMSRWVADSARARETLAGDLDVAYGPSDAERLDIFPAAAPATAQGAPIMVFIHGGYWRAMDKKEHSFPALAFAPAGITLVSINYALAPSVALTEIVRQCRRALVWVYRNAPFFGGDRGRIHVSGHSAGGHLTAMLLATDWAAEGVDMPADLVKGGCPISGLYDLEPIRLTYLNQDVRLDEVEARANSPIHLRPMASGWMTITAGGIESDEFHRQQGELVGRWRDSGLDVEVVESPGMHHFNVVSQLGDAGSVLFAALRSRIMET